MSTFCRFVFLLLVFTSAQAQDRTFDSLKALLKKTLPDSVRLGVVYELVETLPDGEWQAYNGELTRLSQKCLAAAKPGSTQYSFFKDRLAGAYYNTGLDMQLQMKQQAAAEAYDKAIVLFKELHDTLSLGDIEIRLADLYISHNENYAKATNLLYHALDVAKHYNKPLGIADVYLNLARIHYRQKNAARGVAFYHKARSVFRSINENRGSVKILSILAEISASEKKYDQAFAYCDTIKGLLAAMPQGNQMPYVEMMYHQLAQVYYWKGDLDKAIYNYEKSLELLMKYNMLAHANNRLRFLSSCYRFKKQYGKAIDYANKAMDLARQTNNLDEQRIDLQVLYKLYKQSGNYAKALYMHEQFMAMSDTVQQQQNRKQVLERGIKYEFEKRELQARAGHQARIDALTLAAARSQARKNTWLVVLAAGLLLLMVGACFLYNWYRQKNIINAQNTNLLKQKLLRSQMNPHFIFNSLNAIQNYIFKQNTLQAGHYLAQFAEMMRMILDFSMHDQVSLESELQFLNHYLELQQLRFNNKFDYTIEVDKDLEPGNILLPPMLAQPFVENAIEHGIFYKDGRGHIGIHIRRVGGQLAITIEDDGVGLEAAGKMKLQTDKPGHVSWATVITQQRMETLYVKYKELPPIEVIDKAKLDAGSSGVKVKFVIPCVESL